MPINQATLINSAGQKVVVESGSQQAQNYFGQGYQLMGANGQYQAPQQPSLPQGAPQGSQAINGAQYNTQALQQANFSQITPVGNTLYGVPNVASSLTSDQLTGGTPNVPAVTTNNQTSPDATMAGANQYMTQLQNELAAQQAQQQELENRLTTGQNTANDLLAQIGQKGTEYQSELEKYNYTANVSQLQDVNKQIASLTAAYNQRIVDNQGRPILNAIIGGQESLLRRQQASEVGGLSAIAQALQGNITLAQQTAKDAINVKYEPMENQLKQQLQQIEFLYNDLGRADQKKADAQTALLNERLRVMEEQKNTEENISNIVLTAAQKGADMNTLNSIRNAKTLDEAILVASGATPILTPAGLAGLTENDIMRVGSKIYKKGKNWLTDAVDNTPQKIGTDTNGQDLFYDPATGKVVTGNQLSGGSLGNQVGTIMGLPAYDTRAANPGVSRSDRNNNPGNIKASDFTKNWEGVIGVESSQAQDGGNFLIFDSPESGINAIGKLLLTGGYSGMTAERAIKRYNGSGAYGAASVGLDPNKDFQSQLQDPVKLQLVASAIARAEGFTGGGQSYNISSAKTVDELDPLVKNYAQQIVEGTQKFSDIKGNTTQETARLKQEVTNAIPLIKAQKAESANDTKTMAITLANELKNSKSLKAATGLSYWTTKVPGTGAYSFGQTFNQLRDLLAMGNIDKLKGAMSDKDIEFLRNSATKLSLKLSTNEFVRELDNIITRFNNVSAGGSTSGTTSSGLGYTIIQ